MSHKTIWVDNTEYEVVATIHDNETDKDYAVYTDKIIDKNKGVTLYCVLYHEEDGALIPEKIVLDADKEVAKELIISIMKSSYKYAKNKKQA